MEYREYLKSEIRKNCKTDENQDISLLDNYTINEIIAHLCKLNYITLKEAFKLKIIYKFLEKFDTLDDMYNNEKTYYNGSNEFEKVICELKYLKVKLYKEYTKSNTSTERNNIMSNLIALEQLEKSFNNKELSIEAVKEKIIFIELELGLEIKMLSTANKYLKDKILTYIIR